MSKLQQGMLLIVVAQLMIVIIVMTLSFIVVMRKDGANSQLVSVEAQSRLMLHAGLMYIQEGSRLGWAYDPASPEGQDAASTHGWPAAVGTAYGWTDTRDGSLGPRGPRPYGQGNDSDDIPAPSWWQFGSSYKPFPLDNELPPIRDRRFPCPGSAMRAAMPVLERAPYVTDGRYNYNPIRHGDPNDPNQWALPRGTDFYPMAALDPQPQANDWDNFASGEIIPIGQQGNVQQQSLPENQYVLKSQSVGKAWFRVYRELLEDHDADGFAYKYGNSYLEEIGGRANSAFTNDNFPWKWDSVALFDPNYPQLKNWNVFIITCGAGGTRGFRWWSLSTDDSRRALEPITAEESGYFRNEDEFRLLRKQETISWYRVEWSSVIGGFADMRVYEAHHGKKINLSAWRSTHGIADKDPLGTSPQDVEKGTGAIRIPLRNYIISTQGGNFSFIQRLPSEPPNW